jgi:hypothetical protein
MGTQKKEVISQPLLLNIPEVCKTLRLGRTKVYELIAVEGLYSFRKGVMCYTRGRGNERKRRKPCASTIPTRSRKVKKT